MGQSTTGKVTVILGMKVIFFSLLDNNLGLNKGELIVELTLLVKVTINIYSTVGLMNYISGVTGVDINLYLSITVIKTRTKCQANIILYFVHFYRVALTVNMYYLSQV